MQSLIARAPGKLFLLGEYAVLDGTPAIVAGIDRCVEVRVARQATATVRICAPGHALVEFPCGKPPARHAALGFALAAYSHAIAACPRAAAIGMRLDVVSHLDGADGTKLGLGGSAAVTVSIVSPECDAATTRVRGPIPAGRW